MKKEFTTKDGRTVQYDYSEANNELLLSKIISWCSENDLTSGESVCMTDRGQLESPELVSYIVDSILNFKSINDEDEY